MYTRFLQMLKRPENIFLFFCLLVGLLLVFINPPFQGFDETEHFYKIYGFSQGTLNYKKITSYTDGTLLYEKPKTFTAQIVPLSIVQLAAQSKLLNPYIGPDRIIHAPQKISIKNVQELAKIPLNKQYKTIAIHMIPSYTVFSYLPHTFAMIITFVYGEQIFSAAAEFLCNSINTFSILHNNCSIAFAVVLN